jgi:hypothetical protein
VDKTSDLANKTGVAVEKLPDHIQKMERELYSVTMDLRSKAAERDAVSRECDDKKVQLEDLNKSIANTQTIKGMQFIDALEKEKENLVRNLDYVITQLSWERCCRNLLADELVKANKKIYGNIDQSKKPSKHGYEFRSGQRNEELIVHERTSAWGAQRESK